MSIIRTISASAAALTMLCGGSAIAATPVAQDAQVSQEVAASDVEIDSLGRARVTIEMTIEGIDDEIFRDEKLRPTERDLVFNLRDKDREQTKHIRPVRWGGECRVEVEITARLMNSHGDVRIEGTVKLFEGTTTDTDDLDGVRNFSYTIEGNDETQPDTVHVRNDDEGGDWANVRMTGSNVYRD